MRQTQTAASVLDRLFDDDPDASVERTHGLSQDLAQLKQSIARDLEALLNFRACLLPENISNFPHASKSLLDYGISDLSSLSLLNPDHRALLRDRIRIAIERHEPRLGKTRIELDTAGTSDRALRFRVDAVLKVHPARPAVRFDATLQLASNAYQVSRN